MILGYFHVGLIWRVASIKKGLHLCNCGGNECSVQQKKINGSMKYVQFIKLISDHRLNSEAMRGSLQPIPILCTRVFVQAEFLYHRYHKRC